MPLVSIITPLYNEESNLPEFHHRIEQVFAALPDYDYEVLLIDNCSTDGSQDWCMQAAERSSRWKYLRFSRNFNSETSIAAGFYYAAGDAAIVVFSDLQDPPEYIPEFLKQWETGFDVVSGVVQERHDANSVYKFASRAMYALLSRMTTPSIPQNATDFKLLDRAVINALNQLDERVRYNRGLINWAGYTQYFLPYNRSPREQGKSSANLWYRINFAIRIFTSFTIFPLRAVFFLGVFLMLSSGGFMIFHLYNYLTKNPIPGYTTTYMLLLIALGWQGITIGVLGEYLSNVLVETKKRPRWIIAHMENFPSDNIPDTVSKRYKIIESS